MSGSLLGPEYTDKDIQKMVNQYAAKARFILDFEDLAVETASLLASGKIVGWFQGRMEYGPGLWVTDLFYVTPGTPKCNES